MQRAFHREILLTIIIGFCSLLQHDDMTHRPNISCALSSHSHTSLLSVRPTGGTIQYVLQWLFGYMLWDKTRHTHHAQHQEGFTIIIVCLRRASKMHYIIYRWEGWQY